MLAAPVGLNTPTKSFKIINIMRTVFLFLTIILFISACQKPKTQANASADAKRYPFKGKVISVDRDGHKAKIEHDAIPGYMEGMTMDFPIHADFVWDVLKPGADIRAELVVDSAASDPYFLDSLVITSANDPDKQGPPIDNNFAQIGQPVPDFKLTNQDGKPISMKDYKGKALAITFIYAECPLPDYCIKMSTNFSSLVPNLAADQQLKDKVRLLSISFDPVNDTPEKLKLYGGAYLGQGVKPDFTIWQLAVGKDTEVRKIADFFGLRYEVDASDKTQINHSLRTAVIGPDGKVIKIYAGNEWTPVGLLKDLQAALGAVPK